MEFGLTRNIIFVKMNDRKNRKVMIFVAIVHGMVPIVHVFLYFDGNKVSVDGVSYLDLLQEVIWPEIADRSALWWMQDRFPLTARMQL